MSLMPYPAARPDLIFRPLAGDWIVLDQAGRRLHVMNLTAALVWGHIDGTRSVSDLGDVVWNAFGAPPGRARVTHEVEQVLRDFEERGLLEAQGTLQ